VDELRVDTVTTPEGRTTDAEGSDRVERDPAGVIVGRFVVAVGLGIAVGLGGWSLVGHTLTGRFDVIGYPLYADFDVNRYFDAFYLAAIAFPAAVVVAYALLARFGPLRRGVPRRRAPIALDGPGVAGDPSLEVEVATEVGRWGRVAVVGGVLGFVFATGGTSAPLPVTIEVGAIWLGCVALCVAVAARANREIADRVRGVLNATGAIALFPLAARVAARGGVTILSTGPTEHFALFPIQIALIASAIGAAVLGYRAWRRRGDLGDVDRSFVRYLAVPVGIFLAFSFIPGALGPFDTFGEGEYLAAGTRILNGALPWRDIWLIHGLLDDGLKALVGFGVFGFSRWGATTGITAILTPAFFVAFYLFAAYVLRRSWALVAAGAIAFSSSIFVDWDIRYLLLPFVLIALTATLRRPNLRRGAVCGVVLIVQAVLVPELTLALPPFIVAVVVADWYRTRGERTRGERWSLRGLRAWRASIGIVSGALATGGGFGGYLLGTHSLRSFIDYYRNFGDAHSLTGGIPLYTNYALPGRLDRLGVNHFLTTSTPITTRYGIELYLPIVAIVLTVWIIVATVRGGRRLSPEDFATAAMAGLVLLYFQKSISRGDLAHIGEVFIVSTPLIVVLVARLLGSIDEAIASAVARATARRSVATSGTGARATGAQTTGARATVDRVLRSVGERQIACLALFIVVAVQAPVSVASLVKGAQGHVVASVATPAPPPVVRGGPSIGFATPDVLKPGLVSNVKRVFDTEAGPAGAVFDLSDAPGLVEFLLERNPASRFYDISLAITPAAQRLVVADLARNRPRLILFTGTSGLPRWDFINNEVRQYLVAQYVLNHYRPLVATSGELIFIADDVVPAPLPKLTGHPSTRNLYFSQNTCAFGTSQTSSTRPRCRRRQRGASSSRSTRFPRRAGATSTSSPSRQADIDSHGLRSIVRDRAPRAWRSATSCGRRGRSCRGTTSPGSRRPRMRQSYPSAVASSGTVTGRRSTSATSARARRPRSSCSTPDRDQPRIEPLTASRCGERLWDHRWAMP
jgi:hypothetical protein